MDSRGASVCATNGPVAGIRAGPRQVSIVIDKASESTLSNTRCPHSASRNWKVRTGTPTKFSACADFCRYPHSFSCARHQMMGVLIRIIRTLIRIIRTYSRHSLLQTTVCLRPANRHTLYVGLSKGFASISDSFSSIRPNES